MKEREHRGTDRAIPDADAGPVRRIDPFRTPADIGC